MWAKSAKVMVGAGLPLQEGGVGGGWGCAPPRGLPPKFSICNLSSASSASSGLLPLPPCMPPNSQAIEPQMGWDPGKVFLPGTKQEYKVKHQGA